MQDRIPRMFPIVPELTCAQELALLFPFLALASLSGCLLLNLYELQMSADKYYCFCQVPRHINERVLHCWVRGYAEVCKMTHTYRDCLSESMLRTVEAKCWRVKHSRAVAYSSFSIQHCPLLLSSHLPLSPISLSLLSFEILRQDCMYFRLASKPLCIRGYPWTPAPPSSTPLMLGLQAYATIPDFELFSL